MMMNRRVRSGLLCVMVAALDIVSARQAQGGVVAYYRFEEGAGTSFIDSIDSMVEGTHEASYSGSVPVNPIPQTGAPNLFSLQFNNAARGSITAQNFIFHSGFGDATLEFWLNAPSQGHACIFWTRGDDYDANRFNININPDGVFGFDYREPDGNLRELVLFDGTYTMPVDTWTHVGITRTVDSPSSHTYRFYRDGLLVTTATDINPNLPTSPTWTLSGRSGFRLEGLIDEIRFSDQVLQPSQFLNASSAVPEPGSVAIWGIGAVGMAIGAARRRKRRGGGT